MSENDPKTGAQNTPAGTGGNTPAATQPQSGAAATEDQTVTLSKADYENLLKQRERANEGNRQNEDIIASLAQDHEQRQKVKFLDDFLESNKDKYPDLTRDDLMSVDDPDDVEKIAAKMQRRIEDAVQDKLQKVQIATNPVLKPEDRDKQLKDLKKNPDKRSFGQMLRLRQQ